MSLDSEPNEKEQRKGLLFVGGPLERKGWFDFLAALTILKKQNFSYSLTVISSTQPTDLPASEFHWRQNVTDEEMVQIYQKSEIFVCASHAEGWGLPALEAMACGASVITTDNGGSRAYARHDENCLVVPVADPAALSGAILLLHGNKELRDRLGKNGIATAQNFDWSLSERKFASRVENLIGPATKL